MCIDSFTKTNKQTNCCILILIQILHHRLCSLLSLSLPPQQRTKVGWMEFCPSCGSMLLYKYPSISNDLLARFSCPTCPYICQIENKVRLNRHLRLVKKPIDSIFSQDLSTYPTTQGVSCPRCNHGEAKYQERQTRSADEPATIFYYCLNCTHRWKEN